MSYDSSSIIDSAMQNRVAEVEAAVDFIMKNKIVDRIEDQKAFVADSFYNSYAKDQ